MNKHKHRFERLSDTALFCACGEIKNVEPPACTRPHYYPTWVYPYWQTAPTWWPPYTVTSGTSGYVTTSTTANDTSTYTVSNSAGGNYS